MPNNITKNNKTMIKIKMHSLIDLITNSSTEIFTYSEGSVKPMKEMINEIVGTFGIKETCDDMFDTVVMCDDEYRYRKYIERLKGDGENLPKDYDESIDIDQLLEDVKAGKVSKPKWFTDVEESENDWYYLRPETYLYIIPKDEKYRAMAEKIRKFLYSTNHEATYNG